MSSVSYTPTGASPDADPVSSSVLGKSYDSRHLPASGSGHHAPVRPAGRNGALHLGMAATSWSRRQNVAGPCWPFAITTLLPYAGGGAMSSGGLVSEPGDTSVRGCTARGGGFTGDAVA